MALILSKKSSIAKIDDVCDYVIQRMASAEDDLSLLKLQKLLFYIQAWYLALKGVPLFAGRFQAWVHGPVSREIYDRFSRSKMLYSSLDSDDVRDNFDASVLPAAVRTHIKDVLDVYGKYTGNQLEELSHSEKPWKAARGNCKPSERCETEIDEKIMAKFYKPLMA